jgi:hypothetical protein
MYQDPDIPSIYVHEFVDESEELRVGVDLSVDREHVLLSVGATDGSSRAILQLVLRPAEADALVDMLVDALQGASVPGGLYGVARTVKP